MNLKNKNVLVTGGTGMIGYELVSMLLNSCKKLTVASIEDENILDLDVEYKKCDLRHFNNCKKVCENQDIVFHIAGVKGSPQMGKTKPSSFFVPMLQFNTNLLEAVQQSSVEWCLYTSSVGVYGEFDSPEDKMWDTFPSDKDWYGGWAKRVGEMQISAYNIENKRDRYSIIRPANVYGKRDNFDPETGMVIPSLISRIENGDPELTVWGDGTPIRDFIFAKDVASICKFAVEQEISDPLNAGTGSGVSIKDLVDTILKYTKNKPTVKWDATKPSGDQKRVLNVERLKSLGFENFTKLDDALTEIVQWYHDNKNFSKSRYNSFK